MLTEPGLFGLEKSNRDFKLGDSWGKNQFNSSFPASLVSYMNSKGLKPVYIKIDSELNVYKEYISGSDLFGIDPQNEDIYYSFESIYSPYEALVSERLPRIDLVTCRLDNGLTRHLTGIEIKLTALPDSTTFSNCNEEMGCEIVVRPDTIVYLALSIATTFINKRSQLLEYFSFFEENEINWTTVAGGKALLPKAYEVIDKIVADSHNEQKPLLLQPIWKTKGKSLLLEDSCLDSFVWSDLAFTRLFVDTSRGNNNGDSITRPSRTVIWLTKMLYEFAKEGKINHKLVIDELTYDTKNDKAFAISGVLSKKYMKSPELTSPRIKKEEIKCIILGGGEKMLSPERRFDAVILATPGLFE